MQTDAPPFAAPWEAEAFALAISLHERGVFTWAEWTQALAARLAAEPDHPYYQSWLDALETLVAEKGLVAAPELARHARAFAHAAARTPHGQVVTLQPEDFSR